MVNLQLFYDISLSLCQVLDGLLAQCGTVENCEQGKVFSFFTLKLKSRNWTCEEDGLMAVDLNLSLKP